MKSTRKRSLKDGYLEMIGRFPLRPIRNEQDCAEASKILDEFFPRDDLDSGTADYVEVLAGLVADYEEKHHAVDTSKVSGIALLKHLMDVRGMTAADLGRLLGNSGLASLILHGKRDISKAHAKTFARYFGVGAGEFI